MSIVLGIDPGLRRVGYAVLARSADGISLETAGIITTSARQRFEDRLVEIHHGVLDVIDAYHPSEMVIERLLFARNVTSALLVAQTLGVIRLAGALRGLAAAEVGANQVKLALSGDGHATKVQMQRLVALLMKLDEVPDPPDVADAIAIGYTHLQAGAVGR
jgi:crossover junction endodeoxyribonuclease RuvC